jgi:hypothetical protein
MRRAGGSKPLARPCGDCAPSIIVALAVAVVGSVVVAEVLTDMSLVDDLLAHPVSSRMSMPAPLRSAT